MSGAILLTGATGFVGMDILARLLEREEQRIVLLMRARDDAHAQERLQKVLARLYDDPPANAARVLAVRGDLLRPGLGLSAADRERLISSVDRMVHCAASISFELPLAQARKVNVEGVARVIGLAREIAGGGSLRRLVHVSTAYVGGLHAGVFRERDLDLGQQFRNTYERSKHEAEHLLHEASDLPRVIVRPSIVVGEQASGWTPAFNTIYWPIRAFERGLMRELPGRPSSIVDFVPVDYVSDGVLRLLEHEEASGTYHLVAGAQALSAAELVELYSTRLGGAPARFASEHATAPTARRLGPYLSYFDVSCRFDDTRAREILQRGGAGKPDPRGYLGRLLAYAHETRWGKRPVSRQAAMGALGA